MEIRLQTPEKFLHPSYETLCWYAAKNYHNELLSKRVLSPSLCLFFFLRKHPGQQSPFALLI